MIVLPNTIYIGSLRSPTSHPQTTKHPKPQTPTPKPQPPNPKLQTLNSKFQTPNPKPKP